MFPIAIGMFHLETGASWKWFMMQLKRCLGPVSPLVVHRDACKGLENVVKVVFPHAEQRECFGHMWMNLIKKNQSRRRLGAHVASSKILH
jgi:transposase-like protein